MKFLNLMTLDLSHKAGIHSYPWRGGSFYAPEQLENDLPFDTAYGFKNV